jgi:hypothetical protein
MAQIFRVVTLCPYRTPRRAGFDFPDWRESCRYIGGPKNFSLDGFKADKPHTTLKDKGRWANVKMARLTTVAHSEYLAHPWRAPHHAMNRTQRIVLTSFCVLLIGGMNASRLVQRNDQYFQAHPIANLLGGIAPAILVGVAFYWLIGLRQSRRRDTACSGAQAATPKAKARWDVIAVVGLVVLLVFLFSQLSGGGKGSLERPVRLPDEVIRNLKATGAPVENGYFKADVYNSSAEWHIAELFVSITARGETRTFRVYSPSAAKDVEFNPDGSLRKFTPTATSLDPLASGEFRGNIGQFLVGLKQGEWSWGIGQGYGFKK